LGLDVSPELGAWDLRFSPGALVKKRQTGKPGQILSLEHNLCCVVYVLSDYNHKRKKNMRKMSLLFAGIAALAMLAVAAPAFAADTGTAKERTITGEAKCAKCMLKETDKCQTVIQAENKSGKMITYYVADNEVAKNFHEKVCKEAKKVKATGTIAKVDGKQQLTLTKIEVVE
jgi:hypothetical protein